MIQREELKELLNRVQYFGSAADSKVGVLTAIQAAVFAYILPELGEWLEKSTTSVLMRGALVLGIVLMGYGIFKSIEAIFPRTRNPRRLKSVTFFGDIALLDVPEYRHKLESMTEEAWQADYISQIHTNSVITAQKYHSIKVAVAAFGLGMLELAACYLGALSGL
jgi:hypothetical protein